MSRKFILPSLSAAGLMFAVATIAAGSRPPLVADPVADPARTPFTQFIAGAGIVEPSSRSIAIGSPMSRIVVDVPVKVGDDVKAGDPLFRLDDRDLRGELAVRRASLATAKAKLARLIALPRPEDVIPAEARVAETEALWLDAKNLLALAESVADTRAISREEVDRRRHAAKAALARFDQARAELAVIRAGAWKEDLEVAGVESAAAEAQVRSAEIELERLVIRAPFAGQVLQLNVRAGEFAQAGTASTPLAILGVVTPLHVRVDIDENDAWRFQDGASAVGSVRGNSSIRATLRFEYLEPYVVPKKSLTGDTSERVDTRVMQAVFSFDRGDFPIHVGQQMDVFVEVGGKSEVNQ
jgi:HlyD family secretion protein